MNIIFDLDGTLALVDHRRHFIEHPAKDWDAFYKACIDDIPNRAIDNLLDDLYWSKIHNIQIWSGRSDIVKLLTLEWLMKHSVPYHDLRMRKQGDYTPDEILKESWLDEELKALKERGLETQEILVFDDRDKVVAMWRRRGITCCQVAEGNF